MPKGRNLRRRYIICVNNVSRAQSGSTALSQYCASMSVWCDTASRSTSARKIRACARHNRHSLGNSLSDRASSVRICSSRTFRYSIFCRSVRRAGITPFRFERLRGRCVTFDRLPRVYFCCPDARRTRHVKGPFAAKRWLFEAEDLRDSPGFVGFAGTSSVIPT